MRRALAIALLVAVASCSGSDDSGPDGGGVVDRDRDLPADVRAFLDRVVDPATEAFEARYDLLNKNGGGEHTVVVVSAPPELTVTVDGEIVDLTDEAALARFGIFSGFLAANPAAAIEATARRADAGDADLTSPYGLDCIAIPVQGVAVSTWCLSTRLGIFAYVDTPAVRYELTSLTL